MGLLGKLFSKNKVDPEARRKYLLEKGRITEGLIIDSAVDDNGNEVVTYSYTFNGVDHVSSDILSPEQSRDRIKYAPGAKVSVRFDPRNSGNCVLE
jgi:hypothetical protein